MRTRATQKTCLFALVMLFSTLSGGYARAEGNVFDGYRNPQPQDGVRVKDQKTTIGRLELELRDGIVWPLKSSTGEPLGFFFEGQGHYLYRSEDPNDMQVFSANIDRYEGKISHTSVSAFDDFERILLLTAVPLPNDLMLQGAAAGSLSSGAQSAFEKMLAENERSELGFDHLAAESDLNQTGEQVAFAEIEGAKQRVGYFYDAQRQERELMFFFYKPPGVPFRFWRVFSEQTLPGKSRKRLATVDLSQVELSVDTPDNESGSVHAVLSYKAIKGGERILPFSLLNNRDPKVPGWISDKNVLNLRSVKDETGQSLSFSHRYEEVVVDLGKTLSAGQEFKLVFDYDGDFFTGEGGYRHDNSLDFTIYSWWPRAIGWGGATFNFQLTLRTATPYVPIASGDTVSLTEADNRYTLVSKSNAPVDEIAWYAGKYVSSQQTTERGQVIKVHAYAMGREKDRLMIASVAGTLLRMLEDQLGPYPHKEIDIVEVPTFRTFGISHPGLVRLTSATFKPDDPVLEEFVTNHGWVSLLAHELSHQWFGVQITPASEFDNWLTESLAEYQSGIAMQYLKVTEREVKGWDEISSSWRGYAPFCADKSSIEAANSLSGDDSFYHRFCLLYYRGPLTLHMLRSWIGDKGYFALLQKVLKEHSGDIVTTDDFAKATSQLLKTDMQWYFDDWFRKPGTPEIAVSTSVTSGADGKPVLQCKAIQTDDRKFKRLYVPIVLTYADGRKEAKMFFVNKKTVEQSFPLTAQPAKVEVDPGKVSFVKFK